MPEFEFTVDVSSRPRLKPKSTKRKDSFAPLTRLLVLAHQIDEVLHNGRVNSCADLGVQLGLSASRVSQIRRFLRLLPSIQSQILFSDPQQIASIREREFLDVLRAKSDQGQTVSLLTLLERHSS